MLAVAVSVVSEAAVVVVLIDYVVASSSNITLVPVEGRASESLNAKRTCSNLQQVPGTISARGDVEVAALSSHVFPITYSRCSKSFLDFGWRWSLADKIQSKFSASYESTTIVPASILIDEDRRKISGGM